MDRRVDPKVSTGAGAATLGGGALATLLIWIMQASGIPAEQFTPERVVALTAVMAGLSGFVGGWLRKRGVINGQSDQPVL
jgi:hypothetical protein